MYFNLNFKCVAILKGTLAWNVKEPWLKHLLDGFLSHVFLVKALGVLGACSCAPHCFQLWLKQFDFWYYGRNMCCCNIPKYTKPWRKSNFQNEFQFLIPPYVSEFSISTPFKTLQLGQNSMHENLRRGPPYTTWGTALTVAFAMF